jgi:PAS domain S-box
VVDALTRVVDGLPGLVWVARGDGRIEFLNRRWREYAGLDTDAPSQAAFAASIHPDDRSRWDERWRDATATNDPWELEVRLRRVDGVHLWFLCRASPLADADGRAVRWCGINTEIDDRHRTEYQLRTKESHFAAWVESFPGLMVTMDRSGTVELFSRELLEYFGRTREELRNWSITDVVHPDDLERVVTAFTQSVTTGTPYSIEHRCRRADGVYRWFQVRALAARGDREEITGWYVVLSDIDEVKRAEDALHRARSELAQVSRATSLSMLTASVAHEVSQPLSGILTNATTCMRYLDAEPPNVDAARETTRRTIRDGNRAAQVIARLRAMFSRSEFTLEAVDLNEAIRELVALSQGDLQRDRVSVRWALDESLPPITGDRVQLQQVVLNLLRNALDAMAGVDERRRQLVIGTARDASDRVRVSIGDTGVGFDGQPPERLFDAFYTTKPDGMGIGLSVSASIIERHHGRLSAMPNDGPGATFSFWLPVRPARDGAGAAALDLPTLAAERAPSP